LGGTCCNGILPLVSMILGLLLAHPIGAASAQETSKSAATFNERFPDEQALTQKPPERTIGRPTPETRPRTTARKNHKRAAPERVASAKDPPPSRIVVEPRSFLDAGTELLPGEGKFLDYALPPMR
jgi:hypothetical protein